MATPATVQKPRTLRMKRRAVELKKGNKRKPGFVIRLVERVYEGSPRWYAGSDAEPAYRKHMGVADPLGREQLVREKTKLAWGRTPQTDVPGREEFREFDAGATEMWTCIEPECERRTQDFSRRDSRTYTPQEEITCDYCGQRLHKVKFRPIEKKWVYVLMGDPGSVRLVEETYIQSQWTGSGLRDPGVTTRKHRRHHEDNPKLRIAGQHRAVKKKELYHFFASPVQLSRKALQALIDHANKPPLDPPRRVKGTDEQLFDTTVRRRFTGPAGWYGKRWNAEVVPVLEPFAWAASVNEFDYKPVLEAEYELLMNANERAKLNIASVLSGLIGDASKDKFDLVDELDANARELGVKNKAQGWLDAYRDCIQDLANEVVKACERLIEWLDSDAHRIVEMSCQDGQRRDYLKVTLLHYCHVLHDMMGCPAGASFLARLYEPGSGERVKGDERQRFPYKNVLHAANRERGAIRVLRKDLGEVPLNLLSLFGPLIAKKAPRNQEAAAMVAHIRRLGVKAKVIGNVDPNKPFGYQDFKLFKDTLIAFQEDRIEKVGQTYLPKRLHKFYDKIKAFSKWETEFVTAYSLWTGIKIYSEKAKPHEGQRDKWVRTKGKIEYPLKLVQYFVNESKAALAYWATKNYKIDWAKLINPSADPINLSDAVLTSPAETQRYQRNFKFYKALSNKQFGRLLSGPTGVVFGGFDLVVQTQQTIEKFQDGDYGGSLGAGLVASAAVISVSTGVVTSLALFGLEWALAYEAMLGPLGWIAAGLTLLGVIVLWTCSKSDLELFASHCFLGDDYGGGSSGPAWAAGRAYDTWDDGHDAVQRQNAYLINLICSFKAMIRLSDTLAGRKCLFGGFVQPGYLPPTARAEVVIETELEKKNAAGAWVDCKVSSTALISTSDGSALVVGHPVDAANVACVPENTWGTAKLGYLRVRLQPRIGQVTTSDGMAEYRFKQYRDRYGRSHRVERWRMKVRFDITGAGHFLPIGKARYLEMASYEAVLGMETPVKSSAG